MNLDDEKIVELEKGLSAHPYRINIDSSTASSMRLPTLSTFITIAENRPGRVLAITPPKRPPALFTCIPMPAELVKPAVIKCSAQAFARTMHYIDVRRVAAAETKGHRRLSEGDGGTGRRGGGRGVLGRCACRRRRCYGPCIFTE